MCTAPDKKQNKQKNRSKFNTHVVCVCVQSLLAHRVIIDAAIIIIIHREYAIAQYTLRIEKGADLIHLALFRSCRFFLQLGVLSLSLNPPSTASLLAWRSGKSC